MKNNKFLISILIGIAIADQSVGDVAEVESVCVPSSEDNHAVFAFAVLGLR